MDVLISEGLGYLEDHFKDAGFIPHKDEWDIFAVHTNEKWPEILASIKSQWGYGRFFINAIIIKKTSLKNGKTNFVFRLI